MKVSNSLTPNLLYFLVQIGRDPSQDTIARFRALLLRHGFFARSREFLLDTAAGRKLLKNQHLFDERTLDMDYLRGLPKKTLGYQFAKFIDDNRLDPLFYPMNEVKSEEDYIGRRYLQTHDVWHVALGYKPDVQGEIELLAFAFAQFRWPIAPFIICAYLFRQIFSAPRELPAIFESVLNGWSRGQATPLLLAVEWEKLWEVPLDEARKIIGVD